MDSLRRLSLAEEFAPPLPHLVTLPATSFHDSMHKAAGLDFQGLQAGSKGASVRRLQKVLTRWNPRLGVEVNGVFDLKTERAMGLYRAIYSGREAKGIDAELSVHLSRMEDGTFWNSPPTKTPGQKLLYAAAQQLGKPYCLGADGSQATDCGRLVQMAAKGVADGLSRCADQQYLAAKRNQHGINLCQRAEAGDLLFFRNPTSQSGDAYAGITHVGIYVDREWMLAASSGAGKVVLQKQAAMTPYLAAIGGLARRAEQP